MTAILTPAAAKPVIAPLPRIESAEQRILLTGIRWQTYKDLLEDLGDRPVRLTFDEGRLEIMTLSSIHETYKKLLARLLELLTFELLIPIRSLGSTTLNPDKLSKGLEPDECYYIRNEARVRGKQRIDLEVDPPPDLAIEVDISRSSLNRMVIYAALGIAEVWRFDGAKLHILHLQSDGTYEEKPQSLNLPFFPVHELVRFLQPASPIDETTLMRSFVDWVRDRKFVKE